MACVYIMKEEMNLRSDLALGRDILADGSPHGAKASRPAFNGDRYNLSAAAAIRARSCCMHRCHSSCFFDDRLALCCHVRTQMVT